MLLFFRPLASHFAQDDTQLLFYCADGGTKLMGHHGDELRLHLIEFFQMTDILEDSNRPHGLADIIPYRCRMSPEENLPGFPETQFLGNRCIVRTLCR